LAELKQLTTLEIERTRSIPRHVCEELVHIVDIGWTGALPLFNVDSLSTLLEKAPRPDRDQLCVHVITNILTDPGRHPEGIMSSAFENFLTQVGSVQDRVLTARKKAGAVVAYAGNGWVN